MSTGKNNPPLVFIGSTVENLEIAQVIQSLLRNVCEGWVWDQGIFNRSDLTESRGMKKSSPRDNIIFELGFFTGAISKERVFIVIDEEAAPKMPTDLSGITTAKFKRPGRTNIDGALGPACWDIRNVIRKLGLRPINDNESQMKIHDLKKRIDELIGLLEMQKMQMDAVAPDEEG